MVSILALTSVKEDIHRMTNVQLGEKSVFITSAQCIIHAYRKRHQTLVTVIGRACFCECKLHKLNQGIKKHNIVKVTVSDFAVKPCITSIVKKKAVNVFLSI